MAKIIDFSEVSEESGLNRVKRKTRRHRFGRFYRVCLIVILIAAAILAYFIYEKTKVYDSYTTVASAPRVLADGAIEERFGSSILTYSKDGANAVDASGKLLWNQTFDMQSPMMSECGNIVAFADYGGSKIYIQDASGATGTVSTDMPIRKITVSANGYVAAILEDTDVTWIYLYDLNGKRIAYFRTTMEKSGYPIDFDISPNGELVCVSFYYLDCGDVKSSVAFFNFGPVGQNNIDNYVSGYNYSDSLVPFVRFLDDETVISVSSSRMSTYSGAHIPVSVSEMFINDEIQSVYYDKDVVAIVYINEMQGTKYRMELYNTTGEKMSEKAFDFDYSDVEFGNGNVILYGDNNVYIGSYNGDLKYEGTYTEPIVLALPTNVSNRYVFVTEKSIDTVEFK